MRRDARSLRVPPLRSARFVWDEAEPPILRFLLKVVLTAGAFVASPFLALAFLFFLLDKPPLWILIPLSIGALVLVVALVAWLVARAKLRELRGHLDRAVRVEEHLRGP